jgi:adenylate kinase
MKSGKSRIVFLGKPGSGKGTQAQALSRALGLPHLSSGEILRTEIRDGTEFGRAVEEYVLRGEIGPEELITQVILHYIDRSRIGDRYILDGFPRTPLQAKRLDERFPPDRALFLSVPDEAIIDRLSKRYTCAGCGTIRRAEGTGPKGTACPECGGELLRRTDDHPEAIRKRLDTFSREVMPVVRYYDDSGRLARIDGAGRITDIEREILALFP